jgi:branched-chain amino acid transport system permease protein/neutral amino acid transport system permease protein
MFLHAIGFGIVTAAVMALAAVGFTVQFGVTNILNLAYGDVMTAAAFVAYLTYSAGLNPWWGMVFGGLFGAVFSVLLNRFLYRPFIRRGARLFTMIIITIAVSLMLQNGLQAIFGTEFSSAHISAGATVRVLGMVFTTSQLIVVAIAAVALAALHGLLRYTRLGKAMRATASDPELARNCGVQTHRVIDGAWLLSGLLCGLAGVALVTELGSFDSTTGSAFLVPVIAAAVLGGVGHPYGAMLGALIVGLASELAATYWDPTYKDVVAFGVLIAVLLIRPQGIFAEIASQKEVVA